MTDDTQPEPREIMTPLVAAGVDVHGMPLKGCCDNWPECSHVYYAVAAHDAALAASAPSEPSDDSPLNLGCGCPWEENGAATVRHTYHKPDCKWLGSLGADTAPQDSTHTAADTIRQGHEWLRIASKHGKRTFSIERVEDLVRAGDDLVAALQHAEQERDDWRGVAERTAFKLVAAEAARAHIRPMLYEEWAVLMAEHSIVDEARRLSKAAGVINTTRDLDRALDKYAAAQDAAHAARAVLAGAPDKPAEETT